MLFGNLDVLGTDQAALSVDKNGKVTGRDLQLAVAVLLVAMAYEDRHFAPEELDEIAGSLSEEFELNETQCSKLLKTAQALLRNKSRLNFFLETLNFHFTAAQKQQVMRMLWQVAEADGVLHKVEARLAANFRLRLNLSLEQALQARELAES